MKRSWLTGCVVVAGSMIASANAFAGEVVQRVGGYAGDEGGETRSAASLGGSLTQRPLFDGNVSSGSYDFEAGVEQVAIKDISHDKYMSQYFPNGVRENHSASLNSTQTIRKLTDVRVGANWLSDTVTTTRTGSAGIGQWWFHDTIQTSIDFSRTETNGPTVTILDLDRETINLGPKVTSGGATLSLKHLATPTTIWGGNWTRINESDRPPLNAYSLNGKQFIPAWSAAIHGSVTRIINTGEVDTTTSSGSLTGTQTEWAFLKNLWDGGSGRVAYRFVREDEQTRAYGDHMLYGADSYSAGLTQDFKKGTITDRPLQAHVVATRYLSNAGGAVLGEAGLTTKF